ncbi:MAG: tetratricopeptide repeat protein [Rhodospirillales bacterium]|nr:tetratricopeptide repeat protein [Rhodospirillales bacterium]
MNGVPAQQTPILQQTLELAIQHHNAGDLAKAEGFYQQVLLSDPRQPDALHLLGVIAHQMGNNEVAVDLITQALAGRPDYAEAHYNLGTALQKLGRLDGAIATYHNALALRPDYTEAHINLGVALQDLGKLDEAVARYQKVLAIKPDYAEAHSNLGNTFKKLGRLEDAVESYQKAIAFKANFAEAHSNLGNTFQELGRLQAAVDSHQKALSLKPEYTEAHYNLGLVLQEQGNWGDAFTHFRRAIALNPENDLMWTSLSAALEPLSFLSADDDLLADLLHLLQRPTVHLSQVTGPILSALLHHPDFLQILEQTGTSGPAGGMAYGDMAERLSAIPLFLRILSLSPIIDLKIERMLTVLRRAMMRETMAGTAEETGMAFSAALALQCFTNEYVFPETGEEKKSAEQLQQQIAALVEKGRDVPPSLVATLGAYRPLHEFPWAGELAERAWTGDIKAVIERQISEPGEERSLRSQIPRLTSIQNTVSQSVREQYEENPYPRWITTDIQDNARTIADNLRGDPLRLDLGDYQSPENPEILVAGCGTGQQALDTACNFSNARVLAVDLSLSSLSYALRQTKAFGFSNIEYAQADIMELGSLGRQFDLIECAGVLHHLGDPLAGWRILLDLLRPGGIMMIALYSESARQDVVKGRSLITEMGYTASADDIRRCRQEIITKAEGGNREMAKICNGRDFFSLSECRDLLFHVQEHCFTLPRIEAALQDLSLTFLGFEMQNQRVMEVFKKSHPARQALTSLSLWHEFELENPDTFRGMYQFWCRKM